ncbi:MAG: GlsB/YeaQ/YmgE family stress response membrane protein [Verrucomicrobia bacterium]|nr:GlsB/YeaQ/YmgE family stress response membrane protein [Verrucomicrobiota bacterium]
MDLIITFLIGLVVGVVAKLVMPGKDPGGFIITALLGIAGAFIAKMIGQAAGWYAAGEPAGFIAAVGGAIVLLLLYRLLFRRGTDTRVKT